jgi:cell division protein ZapA (FtsZ GTPase activity inhibitor)
MIKVTVNINGMNYNLKGEKEEKYLQGVANFVDTRIKEIISKKAGFSTTAASVLAAVNIADELYECDLELDKAIKNNKSISEENTLLKQKIKAMNLELENVIKEKINVKDDFEKKEIELAKRYENVEITYKGFKEQILNIKDENEKLKMENKLIVAEVKKNKNINESINK